MNSRFGQLAAASLVALAATVTATQSSFAQDASGRPEVSPMSRVPEARAKQAKEKGSGDRVFGGHEAAKGAWPFQVALLTSNMLDESPASQANAQFCGGSLIAPGWVLTAAHCLVQEDVPVPAESITVLTEATNLAEGKRYKVSEVIVFETFTLQTLDNDIGLLRLAEDATAPTIKLPAGPTADTGKVTVTGWGMMEDGTFPVDLMEADLDVVPNAACNSGIKQIYARDLGQILKGWAPRMRYSDDAITTATTAIAATMRDPLTDNMICSGIADGARDACNGDSGGPLFTNADGTVTQVGIVSWGEGPMDASAACGHANAYGVYTRLSNYLGWIDGKMKTPAPTPAAPPATTGAGSGTLVKPKP